MNLSRRNFLRFAAAGAAGAWPLRLSAEPYVNNSGLEPGQFVWEGWKAKEGPVLVIVSRTAQMAHIYRGGVEIAMSTCTTGRPGLPTPTGVFLIRGRRRERAYGESARLAWTGVPLHASNAARYPASHACVRVPPPFAKLLFEIMGPGAVVVIADERTYPFEVVRAGLLGTGAGTQEARAGGMLHRPAVVTDAGSGAPTLAVVVSGADRTAYIMRDGAVEAAVPTTIRGADARLGTHIFSLVSAAQDGGPSRWIAFGLGERPTDAHLATWIGTTALERVSLAGRDKSLLRLETARPGTTLVITDEAAPPITRTAAYSFVVLGSETLMPVAEEPAPPRERARRRTRASRRVRAKQRRPLVETLIGN